MSDRLQEIKERVNATLTCWRCEGRGYVEMLTDDSDNDSDSLTKYYCVVCRASRPLAQDAEWLLGELARVTDALRNFVDECENGDCFAGGVPQHEIDKLNAALGDYTGGAG